MTERKDLLHRIGAPVLATSMLLANAGELKATHDETQYPLDPNSINYQYDLEKKQKQKEREKIYDFPLQIVQDFTALEVNPDIKDLFEKISHNPSQHIDIVDPSGNSFFWTKNSFTYVVYGVALDDIPEDFDPDSWSIKIVTEDSMAEKPKTSVHLKLDKNWEIFDGNTANLSGFQEIDPINLGIISDKVFRLPEEIQNNNWEYYPYSTDIFGNQINGYYRTYEIDEGSQYAQYLLPDNIVVFSSPYPISDMNPANTPEKN